MRVEALVRVICSTPDCGAQGDARVMLDGGGGVVPRMSLVALPGGWADARPWGTFWKSFASSEAIPHPTDQNRVRQPIGDEPRPVCNSCRISWLDSLRDSERPPVPQ